MAVSHFIAYGSSPTHRARWDVTGYKNDLFVFTKIGTAIGCEFIHETYLRGGQTHPSPLHRSLRRFEMPQCIRLILDRFSLGSVEWKTLMGIAGDHLARIRDF
jgi:hypothetical protein